MAKQRALRKEIDDVASAPSREASARPQEPIASFTSECASES